MNAAFVPSLWWTAAADSVPSGWERYGVFGSLAALFLGGVIYLARRRDTDHARELAAAQARVDAAEARADRLEIQLQLVHATYAEKSQTSKQETLQAIGAANNLAATVIREFQPPRSHQ